MRLALLSPLPPDPSALADHAAHYKRALNGVGIDVLTPLVGQRPLDSLAAARAWVAERDWRRVDVVHAELGPGRSSEFWVLCALAGLAQRPALSVTVHEPDRFIWQPLQRPWRTLFCARALPRPLRQLAAWLGAPQTRWSERRLARSLEGVVVHSEAGAARLIRRLKVSPDRVSVLPLGVNPALLQPLPPADPVRVLCVSGPGQAVRPLEDLLAALRRLHDEDPEAAAGLRLTLVGSTAAGLNCPARTDPLRQLPTTVRQRGLQDAVDWVLDPDVLDVPHLIGSHHVVLVPQASTPDPFNDGTHGVLGHHQAAVNAAIAGGRALIVCGQGELAEAVTSGNGVGYPPGAIEALAGHLRALVRDPDLLVAWTIQAQALRQVRQWMQVAPSHLGHFQRVMARVRGMPT